MGTIVVGFVAKPEGRAALRRAAEEAALRDFRLVVVNAARQDTGQGQRPHSTELDHQLDDLRTELTAAGIDHEVRQLVRGQDPAEDLISVATEVNADFIVIGLRRRSPVGKLILGSNAQRVLLDAPCPVLAVKAAAG
jgi:nucleotide-binding universal stress UspA family protein